jgi:hypothetical protein
MNLSDILLLSFVVMFLLAGKKLFFTVQLLKMVKRHFGFLLSFFFAG